MKCATNTEATVKTILRDNRKVLERPKHLGEHIADTIEQSLRVVAHLVWTVITDWAILALVTLIFVIKAA